MCCHGNGILWQKLKNLAANYFLSSPKILMKFGTRCLPWGVRCAYETDNFLKLRKCVAMVFHQKLGKNLRRELLPQFFTNSHEI